jgi:lysophospholipase L1-like esterase
MDAAFAVLLALALALIAVEVLVRAAFRLRGIRFDPPKHLAHLYLAPHPYLPYAFVPGITTDNAERARYTLHPGDYEFRDIRTNDLRSIGAAVGAKPPGTIRILCLGHSTVESTLWDIGGSTEYSLPLELERALRARADPRRYEVINCGVGGWTTAEILVHFALTLLDADADVVILYHGMNDLVPSLTPGFRSDYSHSRRNLAGRFWKIRLAARLPDLRWWKSYSYAATRLIASGNVRHDVHANISVAPPDPRAPFRGLATERRNIESLIDLCHARGIDVLLSTFAYFLYPGATGDPMKVRLRDGVLEENDMLRAIARERDLPLVDIARELPLDDASFLDSVHLTPDGMRSVAARFADAVLARPDIASAPRAASLPRPD